jgi:CheY-like chemotaxis protein
MQVVMEYASQILIIEDIADIAENLQYNLRRKGFTTVIAESGEKGLRIALNEKNPPALILLDTMLPGMSGIELCRPRQKLGACCDCVETVVGTGYRFVASNPVSKAIIL